MKPTQDNSTRPWSRADLEAFRDRLAASKRMLDAFRDRLAVPSLLRQVPNTGQGNVEAVPLSGLVTVGREGDPPFCFPEDRSMSGRHFRILTTRDGVCYVQDLQSRNHLWVNGKEVLTRRLVHGDQIHAGDHDFVFHDGKSNVLFEW